MPLWEAYPTTHFNAAHSHPRRSSRCVWRLCSGKQAAHIFLHRCPRSLSLQSCTSVPSDVASQLAEMKAFNSRVPAPSTTSPVDCTTGKNLKSGIDAYRSALIADPASGCLVSLLISPLASLFPTRLSRTDNLR